MTLHIFRVVVRGEFADLSPQQRADLVAAAPDHDIFLSAYTASGTFTYEPQVHAFSYRYELRERTGDGRSVADAESSVRATAEALAVDDLTRRGLSFKRLRSNAVDMADMWIDRGS